MAELKPSPRRGQTHTERRKAKQRGDQVASKYKTFNGKRYERSIGGQPDRKFAKSFAAAHAKLARKAGMNARVVNLGELGWAVYTRKRDPMRTWY